MIRFEHSDCFDFLLTIEKTSVDLAICDLPYGTTQCKWDCRLPLDKLWPLLWNVMKPSAPILMFASQPFTSILVSSQIEQFKYEWVWEKSKASNFLDCKKRPLKAHECVLVFCRETPSYYPQMESGEKYKARPGKKVTEVYGKVKDNTFRNDNEGLRYPRSVQYFKTAESEGKVIHSTQKPVSLLEYLIKTYTQEGSTVLDPCAGSGTTAVASIRLKRSFLGCELDKNIYNLAKERLDDESKYKKDEIDFDISE